MSEKAKRPKRCGRQFTLRGLLVLMTLIVLLLVGWRTYIEPYREQRRVMALIEDWAARIRRSLDRHGYAPYSARENFKTSSPSIWRIATNPSVIFPTCGGCRDFAS